MREVPMRPELARGKCSFSARQILRAAAAHRHQNFLKRLPGENDEGKGEGHVESEGHGVAGSCGCGRGVGEEEDGVRVVTCKAL